MRRFVERGPSTLRGHEAQSQPASRILVVVPCMHRAGSGRVRHRVEGRAEGRVGRIRKLPPGQVSFSDRCSRFHLFTYQAVYNDWRWGTSGENSIAEQVPCTSRVQKPSRHPGNRGTCFTFNSCYHPPEACILVPCPEGRRKLAVCACRDATALIICSCIAKDQSPSTGREPMRPPIHRYRGKGYTLRRHRQHSSWRSESSGREQGHTRWAG